MLAAKNLERLIEMEEDLKSKYEADLNDKSNQITKANEENQTLRTMVEQLEAKVAAQLQQILSQSSTSTDTKRLEQLNRELEARSVKLQEEMTAQKKRLKGLQRDLAAERTELKELKQYDAPKMKANLAANKKKLAEKTTANELLQKNNSKLMGENSVLKAKNEELEAKLESLESADSDNAETEQTSDAA